MGSVCGGFLISKQKGTDKQRHRTIRMMVIPEPAPNTRSVLLYTGPGTVVMRGQWNVTMVCGKCASPLLEGVKTAILQNMVVRCQNCGAFNESLV